MNRPTVQLEQVTKRYDAVDGGEAVNVLDSLDLSLSRGDSVAVVGPSGCGKTTLLNLIGALDRPTSGRITLNGRDLAAASYAELAEIRNREVGFVFQDHYLLPQCTALENALIPTLAGHATGEDRCDDAVQLLERVGLGDRRQHLPSELSGGQRQRVAIVRALINAPAILLVDEPTGMLDEQTAGDLVDLLVELNQRDGVTLLMVTHALPLAQRMQRTLRLHHGQLVDVETPA